MAIVKSYQRKTDTTYVYESESYWDPEKQQSRSRRKLIGKIDKETGEIIPTGKRGRKKAVEKEGDSSQKPKRKDKDPKAKDSDQKKIIRLEETIDELKKENLSLRTQIDGLKKKVRLLTSRSEKAEKELESSYKAGVYLQGFKDVTNTADYTELLDHLQTGYRPREEGSHDNRNGCV